MNKTGYTEIDKWNEWAEKFRIVVGFLDWLRDEKQIGLTNLGKPESITRYRTRESMFCEYAGIDYAMLQQERKLMMAKTQEVKIQDGDAN